VKGWTASSPVLQTSKQPTNDSDPLGLSSSKSPRGGQTTGPWSPKKGEIGAIELLSAPDTSSSSWFYVPSVLTPQEKPNITKASDTIHILGNDARSMFLAHALAQIYGSVRMLGRVSKRQGRYKGVAQDASRTVPNAALSRISQRPLGKNERIKNLIITKSPGETIAALEPLQDRIDNKTAVCLMQDGLGIAEAINDKLFHDKESQPEYMLGHMTQDLKYDRNMESVRKHKGGMTCLTRFAPGLYETSTTQAHLPLATQVLAESMLQNIAHADYLNAGDVPFDRWLKMKLPTLAFASVIEPVCAMMECNYQQILRNRASMRVVDDLLKEICMVVECLPEVQNSAEIQRLVRGEGLRKQVFEKLRRKRDAQSSMLLQIKGGWETDIDFLNGYFITRANRLGIKTPANEMIVDMIKAKRHAEKARIDADIPFEEITKPKFR
jgi:cytochrome b translational activator protein CBS2, mitochondrial